MYSREIAMRVKERQAALPDFASGDIHDGS